jgi:DNA-directed RNA polymerase specialized sigma24 family protein
MTDLAKATKSPSTKDARRSWARHVYWRSRQLATEMTPTAHPRPALGRLGQLTHPQRACLALCLFGGQTRREAAELLDIPPATVAHLLTSGLRAVAQLPGAGTAVPA